jgi:hypothetical protein
VYNFKPTTGNVTPDKTAARIIKPSLRDSFGKPAHKTLSTLEVLTWSGQLHDCCTHTETFDKRVVFEHNALERVGTSVKAAVGILFRTHGSCASYQYSPDVHIRGQLLTAHFGVSARI